MMISYSESPLIGTKQDILMLETDKMRNQSPKLWKYGYKTKECDLLTLKDIIKSDYRCYSAGYFTDGKAVNNAWQFQDCVIFDVDGGLRLEDAYKMFCCYDGFIATTKSHSEENHRFRIVLPIKKRTSCTAEEYTEAIRLIMDTAYPFLDKQCKDAARIYFGNSNAKFTTLDGNMIFDLDPWVEKAKLINETSKWAERKEIEVKAINDGSKADWYRANWKTDKMLEVLKHSEKFSEGGRNGTLYAWGKHLQSIGLSEDEVEDAIYWLNDCGDGIPEKEIRTTVFKSLRKRNG